MRTAAVALLMLVGCDSRPVADAGADGSGGPALFADIQYATRCDATPGCAPAEHDICGFNGSEPCIEGTPPVELSCEVVEDGARTISFSARQGDGPSLAVGGLTVATGGGRPFGSACRVTIDDGANVYEGACGGSAPSETQPCQITEVAFTDDMGNPTFEARLFCEFLENRASPALQIEVASIGLGPGPAMTPARIRIANCNGLTCTPSTCAIVAP